MSNTIMIPVVDYKMDKVKFFIIAALVVVVLLFVLNPGGFMSKIVSSIIDGVGSAIKGVGNGIVQGISDVTGVTANDQDNASQSARIDKYWKGNQWVSWMTSAMYSADPSNASIDDATATNLYNNVESATGSSILGLYISAGDFSGIQQDFSNVIGNQTDVSYVSFIAEKQTGKTLGQICQDPNNFYNETIGSSGEKNITMLADFLDWVNGLPAN